MDEIARIGFLQFGALSIGWICAFAMGWRLWFDTSKVMEANRRFEALIDKYHDAIVDSTRVTERLAGLIEERSRIQAGRTRDG